MMNLFLIFRNLQKNNALEKFARSVSPSNVKTKNDHLYYKDIAGIAIFAMVAFFVLAIALFTN